MNAPEQKKMEDVVVTAETVDSLLYRLANLDPALSRLLILIAGFTDADKAYEDIKSLLAEIHAAARHPSAVNFQFPKQHKCAGKTGRDVLNAMTDERESNGSIRKLVKEQYKVSKSR